MGGTLRTPLGKRRFRLLGILTRSFRCAGISRLSIPSIFPRRYTCRRRGQSRLRSDSRSISRKSWTVRLQWSSSLIRKILLLKLMARSKKDRLRVPAHCTLCSSSDIQGNGQSSLRSSRSDTTRCTRFRIFIDRLGRSGSSKILRLSRFCSPDGISHT